jgi:ppGpp synthetase/RelA/SpoT-type nucleotidyltranferase
MNNVVQKYREIFPSYETYAKRLETLLVELLQVEGVRVHFIESRAKTPESFKEKISRPGKAYDDPLHQLPDLVGVRVVLYYQDDIVKVGNLVRHEFEVLEEEHSHQAERYSPDQFGYLSAHYVVRLNNARATLSEWRAVASFKAEIQVRTVLQHSWAAVSHALQYKREGDVPIALRRKLFRLAGLFELADEEFMEIRDAGLRSTQESQEIVKRNITNAPIDAAIIREIVATSPLFKQIIKTVNRLGYEFDKSPEEEDYEEKDYTGEIVEELERLGLNTIEDVNSLLSLDYSAYLAGIKTDKNWIVTPEFVLLLLIIAAFPNAFTVEYLIASYDWHQEIAKRVLVGAHKHKPD